MILRRLLVAATAVLGLALVAGPAVAAPAPDAPLRVPNATTVVINIGQPGTTDRAFRVHYPTSASTAIDCRGSYDVLQPDFSSEGNRSDVNSMRLYEDTRIWIYNRAGTSLLAVRDVNPPAGGSKCYPGGGQPMTNERIYKVLSSPDAF